MWHGAHKYIYACTTRNRNETNHEETSCEMDHTISKLYRIVIWSVQHLHLPSCNAELLLGPGITKSGYTTTFHTTITQSHVVCAIWSSDECYYLLCLVFTFHLLSPSHHLPHARKPYRGVNFLYQPFP